MFSAIPRRVEVENFACDKINQNKGLVYIHDYNIPDIEDYGSELKKEYNLLDVQNATWIKTKKLYLYSTPIYFQRKRTTEIHRNPRITGKN